MTKAVRALPIRSSPVGTAPSLRASLDSLHGKTHAKRAPSTAHRPTPKPAPFVRKAVLEEFEARLLMSADLNPLAHDTLLATPATLPAEFRALGDRGAPSVVTSAEAAPIQRTNELVFVDTATPDYARLVEDMRAAALGSGRNLEFVLIDAERDGIRKITDTLAKRSDLDAVHIVSHATDGSVQLGSAQLDFDTLLKRSAAIKKWGAALGENGDILIYGCDLAATAEGKSLVDALARLTGADVAASDDPTGAARRGGDWKLEYVVGSVEARGALADGDASSYGGLLALVAQGGETLANSTTAGTQTFSTSAQKQVAMASDGSFVAVWESPDANLTGIIARRFDAAGNPMTGEIQVNTSTAGAQAAPAVGIDALGNFVVSWNSPDAGGVGMFARRFDSNGNPLSGEFQVNTTTGSDQNNGGIAVAANGRFVVGWETNNPSDGGGSFAGYVRVYDAAGNPQTGEVLVNTTTALDQFWDSVAMDASGNFVVVATGLSIDGSGQAVFGRRFDAAGNGLGAQFTINTSTAGNQSYASVAMNASGAFVVSWMSDNGGNLNVHAQRYSSAGVAQGGEFLVNQTPGGNQGYATVGMDNAGRFTIVWQSDANAGDAGLGIYRREYAADGTALTGELRVNTTVAGNQGPPALAVSSAGHVVALWAGNGTGDGDGVFFQRYASTLVVDTAADLVDGNTSSIANLLLNKGADGYISLREAIQATNNTANVGGPDVITFRIAPGGVQTINLGSALPQINEAVIIDGTTQTGFAGAPLIELNGLAAGAGVDGLVFNSGADNSTVRGLLINRFDGEGIWIRNGASGITVAGNYIGIDATGNLDLGNSGAGISVEGGSNTIGGTAVADRNVISGNTGDGVLLLLGGATNNTVRGNYIGTNAAGGTSIGNAGQGVLINVGASNNQVRGNVIAASGSGGIRIIGDTSDANVIQGNWIGTDASGTINLGNALEGIAIQDGDNNTIGGPNAGEGNFIAFNATHAIGVYVAGPIANAPTGNSIRGNSVYSNGGLGIELANVSVGDGVTQNDATDADTGANRLQNFPVLSRVSYDGTNITIGGYLQSVAGVATYNIDFYASASADGTGYGEGRRYLGFGGVNTNAAGFGTFDITLVAPGLAATDVVTATATTTAANPETSEFSKALGIRTLVVDTVSDVSDGTVTSINSLILARGADGRISLREAILATNATLNVGGQPDRIIFDIPSAGPTWTINVGVGSGNTPLPVITEAVIIDGTTQPGFGGTAPVIELNGLGVTAGAAANRDGLRITGGGSTIRGLTINRFQNSGIELLTGDANTIVGNYIGTNAAGAAASANGIGININTNSDNNVIGGTAIADRNVISGNTGAGISVNNSDGSLILGNYIGANAAGTLGIANGGGGINLNTDVDNSVIGGTASGAGNLIRSNTGNGVRIQDNNADGNRILGNAIFSNTVLGIDLNKTANGVDANDAGDGDAQANQAQNYPVLAAAVTSGASVRITGTIDTAAGTFRIEFFTNTAGDPEGRVFLGALTLVKAAGVANIDATFAGAVAVGEAITATATDAAGNTSEFSAARAVTAVGATRTISGTVYEDIDADADVGEAGTQRVVGATVRLYQDAGTLGTIDGADGLLISTTTTDALGNYSFIGLAAGQYWVAVDSRTIGPSAGYNAGRSLTDIWAEQTYAVDGASGVTFVAGAQARYGGRGATVSDIATTLANAEHVVHANVTAADDTGQDFGFSFNVVTEVTRGGNGTGADDDDATSARRTVQGSLRQFLDNAASIAGGNTMRFVPAEAVNVNLTGAAGDEWWRVIVSAALPQITDAFTIVDGTAYNAAINGTVRNDNSGTIGDASVVGGFVGLGADGVAGTGNETAFANVERPELEISEVTGAVFVGVGLDVQASNVTIQRLSIHGFGDEANLGGNIIWTQADIRVGFDPSGTGTGFPTYAGAPQFTGVLIQDNVIGTWARSLDAPNTVAGGSFGELSLSGIAVFGPDNGTIRNNLIGYAARFGAFLSDGATGWLVEGNEFRDNASVNSSQDGLDLGNSSANATVRGNLFYRNWGGGVDSYQGAGGHLIENNTFLENGRGETEPSAIRLYGSGSTVRYNLIQNNGDPDIPDAGTDWGAGVLVVRNDGNGNTPSFANRITRNSFSGNVSNAIDLVGVAGDNSLGDGITLNDGLTVTNAGNRGLDYPVITAAVISGANTIITGTTGAGYTVELYRAQANVVAGNPGDANGGFNYGEGVQYLGTATADALGRFTLTVSGLVLGNAVSGIAIDGAGNTSEFGRNAIVGNGITGTIFDDGDADADVAEGGTGRFANVAVRLYQETNSVAGPDATDTYVTTVYTDALGSYAFGGLSAGTTYYVLVDSKTITPNGGYNGGFGPGNVWAEQTWGDNSTTAPIDLAARYGGRNAATSDNAAALGTAEHLARADFTGANLVADFGFSFSAVVNNRGDATDNDVSALRMQQGTLRQFILNANALAGVQTSNFSIGSGAQTITPTAVLPEVTDATILDATTQEGWASAPIIELNGTSAGAGEDGLTLGGSGGSTVRGFVINRFGGSGIEVNSSNNVVAGNYFGTNAGGTAAQANGFYGIYVSGGSNTIGGTAVLDRNVISGNTLTGIYIEGAGAAGNVVLGNHIGTNALGSGAVANGNYGVAILGGAAGNTIGGTTAAARNVISGSSFGQVDIEDVGTTGNTVAGNYIGTNAAGTAAIATGPGVNGVIVQGGAGGNTIGGSVGTAGNLISGNTGSGVLITGNSDSNTLRGNWIGTNGVGADLGNTLHGISVQGGVGAGTSPNTIIVGGIVAGEANTIAFNDLDGVNVSGAGSSGIQISGNSIHSNDGLGIDLAAGTENAFGVTANDFGANDADGGPNTLQNYPSLSTALVDSGAFYLTGSLDTAAGNYRIHIYASAVRDPSTHGEGERYVGYIDLAGHPGGNFVFSNRLVTLVAGAPSAGEWISVTAMQLAPAPERNTSEFSVAIQATTLPTVSGTLFHDVNGNANVGDDAGAVFGDVLSAVRIYGDNGGTTGAPDAGDTQIGAAVNTNASGVFTFTGLVDGTYWVTVDSKTLGSNANVWAEQTYGDDYLSAPVDLGARYGGRNATQSDNAAALTTAEHVARVVVSGGNVTDVDFGFSFNVVTNVRGDGGDDDGGGGRLSQGTLHQFVLNANNVAGANTMRFVPAVAPNQTSGADGWWRLSLATALAPITDADTTIDGRAYYSTAGVWGPAGTTVRDANTGVAGTGGTVGVDAVALAQINRPELEIVDGAALNYGLQIIAGGDGSAIRRVAIFGFGNAGNPNHADIQVAGANGVTIEQSIIGMTATGVDPSTVALARSDGNAIRLDSADNGFIQDNLIGYAWRAGIDLRNGSDGWFMQSNEIRANGWAAPNDFDGINIVSGTGNTVRWNLLADNQGPGLDLANQSSTSTVENNTIRNNALGGGTERFGFRATNVLGTSNNLVRRNVITGNQGAGVLINDTNGPDYFSVELTENSIFGNTGIGIDLNPPGGGVGDGVTVNDAGDGDNGPNGVQNFPVLQGAGYDGTNLTVRGTLESTANTNFRIEFFASGAVDPSGSGEGQRFLGSYTVNTGVSGTVSFATTPITAALAAGEVITATATNLTLNATSEFSAALYSVSGSIYEDVNGDALLGDAIGRNGVTVRLYRDNGSTANTPDAADALVANGITYGAGGYLLFAPSGVNFVVVDSRTVTPGAGVIAPSNTDDVWADQTYAAADATSVQAVYYTGSHQYDTTAGAFYGGLRADRTDDGLVLDATSAVGAEHIQRVTVAAGGTGVAGVDSAYSFSAIVNTRGDAADDDGAADRMQQGSLRQFILNSNAIAGTQTSNFSIGSGAVSIAPTAALPTITDTVILDATTQEGWTAAPIVELDGSSSGGAVSLRLQADGTTVRGFVINRFGYGVYVESSSNLIAGNWIGLDATGTLARGNAVDGIVLVAGVAANTIGGIGANDRNVISDSGDDGVSIDGASGTVVIGNYIGTNAAGTAAVGNAGDGVAIQHGGATPAVNNRVGGTSAAERNVISGNASNAGNGLANVRIRGAGTTGNIVVGNYIGTDFTGTVGLANPAIGVLVSEGASGSTIGGTAAGSRNVIAASATAGIELNASSSTTIEGNYIGVDVTGNAALGNGTFGIWLRNAANSTIGGTTAAERNVIGGSLADDGIELNGAGSTGNVIQGNYVGIGADGSTAVGNSHSGIAIFGASGNTIGGMVAGAGNVIGASGHSGVWIGADGNLVQGNLIGTDATGTLARGNQEYGVALYGSGNTIGGTVAGAGNTIANSGLDGGVLVGAAANGNAILGNSIHSNSGLGIDIEDNGVTPNDALDGDGGGNGRQNFPVIVSAQTTGAAITIAGSLSSTASRTFRLEFFANPTGDASGHGEGRIFLGTIDVTTDGTGNVAFTTPALAVAVPVGHAISATATDQTTNDTSEFSANVAAAPLNSAPANSFPGAVSVDEDTALAFTGANLISVADAEGNVATMRLTVANGTLNVTLSGAATISAGANGSADMTVSGTQADINATVASLAYQGVLNFNGADTLTVRSTDGGGLFDQDSVAVTVNPVNDAPAITNLSGDVRSYAAGSGAVIVDQGIAIAVTDVDSANFDSGALSVTIAAGEDAAEDVLAIDTSGTVSLSAGTTVGSVASVGGVAIGTITSDGAGGNDLVVAFNANSTLARVQTLARAITYQNTDADAPTPGGRTIRFSVSDGDGATSAAVDANISVKPTASIAANDPAAGEPANNGQFTVTLNGTSATDTVLSYSIGGTAAGGADYTALSGTVTVLAGATTATIDLNLLDDLLLETTETVVITLTGVTTGDADIRVNAAANSATASITDNDAANAVLSVTTQGVEGGTNIVYTVTLSAVNATGAAISFDIDDLGTGTAISGTDYTAIPGAALISVANGASSGTFTVSVTDDALLEATETVAAQISNPTNAAVTITGATATANITDNDTANAVLSVTTQGVEGGTNIVYTVTLSAVNNTGAAISFDLDDLGAGTATSGADYTAIPGAAQISVAAGASTGTFTVTVTDDALLEATETVAAQISNASNAAVSITGAAATASITDNDTANAVLSVTTQGVEGGSNIVYTVTLSAVNATGAAIGFDIDDLVTGTATSGADYTAIPGAALISVANGASSGTFTVTVTDDALLEGTETVTAQISNSTNAAVTITGAGATANITDNDTANAVLSVTTQGVEGGTNIVYTVTLSAVNNTGTAITFDIDDLGTGTAISGADYTAIPGAALISVANGASWGTFTVTVADDALLEATETVTAQISNASSTAVTITGATATANITDNDTANAVLSVTTQGAEGGTNIVYTVTLSVVNNTGAAISFDIDDLGTGMATSGADYTAIPAAAQIAVAAGASSGTVTVTVTDDALLEATETVAAQISNASNAAVSITGAAATASITDNDTANAVLSVTTQGVEGGTNIVYTVTLWAVNATGAAISFDIDDVGTGTATSGADYTAIPGAALISVANGASSGTFTVSVTDDALLEATETVAAQISNSSNAAVTITGAAATANIADNDTANAVLSVSTQGVEGGTNIVYTVTLSAVNNTGAAISFDLDDLGTGTATSGADYTAIPGAALISVAAGASTGTFMVTVTDDALLEATETVAAQISNSSNAAVSITGAAATANITDNDTANAVLSVSTQGVEGGTNIVYTVTLSAVNNTGAAISFDLDDLGTGTATSGADYTAIPGAALISVAAGASTGTFMVTVTDDALLESTETVAAQISNASNTAVTITGAAATASITDNDTANAVLSVTTQGAEGGTNIVYTVTLSAINATGAAISFDIDDLGTGTATSGADYTAIPGAALISVANGASSGTFTVTVADDALLETTETVAAQISNSSNAAVTITGAAATANITDNDTANAVLSVSTQGVEGGTNIVYTVTLSAVNNTGAAISFDIDDLGTGTATSGADYTAVPGAALISVAAGASTGTFVVTVTDDALLEATETVAAQISNASHAAVTITGATAAANITDNDTANAVLSVTTQGVEGGTNIVYTVTLSAVNATGAAISFDIDDLGTGTAISGADYTAIPGAALISVANGASTGTFTVTVTDDALLEATETVAAQISNSSNAAVTITGAAASANITDNDTANAVLSVTTQGVEGGTNIVYTVTLSAVNNTGSTITFDIDDLGTGTAASGADYTAVPGAALISVAAGASSGTFTVTVTDDALLEVTETVAAQISNASNAAVTITGAAASANITDNDTANAVLSVTTQGVEGGTNIVYTVTLSAVNATGAAISFDIDDLGAGTAISGTDYFAIPGAALISVASGASTGTFTVTVTDDALLEATETLTAQISNPTNATVTLTGATATANITDNDTALASIAATAQASEPATNGQFTVTLSQASSTDTIISYAVSGTATPGAGNDYVTPVAGTVTILAGATTVTIDVFVLDDPFVEAPETVVVTLTGIVAGDADITIDGAANAATVNIASDDVNLAPIGLADAHAMAEDGTLTVLAAGGVLANDTDPNLDPLTAVLAAGPANGSLTLNADGSFTYQPNADWNGADSFTYRAADGSLQSGTVTVTITVAPVNDAPALGNNVFAISSGGTLALSGLNLSASDVDNAAGSLVFVIDALANGQFELAGTPGVAIASFTQAQVLAGQVQFVHLGAGTPAFNITVTDGASPVGPVAANIVFTGSGTIATPPSGGGDTGGGTTLPSISLPPVFPLVPPSLVSPSVSAFLPAGSREQFEEAGSRFTEAAEPVVVAPVAAESQRIAQPDMQLPTVRSQGEIIETTLQRPDVTVEPLRAEMQVIPTKQGLDLNDEESQRIEIVLNSVRITGIALSVGAVWWAARAAGLVASLLASTPAWRHVDPLPVLGRDEEDEEEDQWSESDESNESAEDRERRDDEHRAAWVLEDRESRL